MSLSQAGLNLGAFLSHLARRQEVISSNIANADTPGYRTRDLTSPSSFAALLEGSLGDVHEATGLADRNDGNNVSVDREARLLTENTLRFNLVTQMLRGELKTIRSAIQEGK
jgi:flagellar basal-body rod protein FlgB